ncbi:putative exosome-associated protein 2 [Leishmania mexicana MHOM/GT/2001/U1103]|uniref:Ribosomal RNA-processing protein 43 n=1 Tax=Leishmania mexicana (strain MHOM/GT/2001/U1103) TaxID=929439 RepID=E9B3D0_LEIMU|nr:putative exosome-associated protein 2 [Leishmania mexicana MHOM/GT/2001/U1103]CBZ29747.1 putative exosome-associated protein 2 [Leishmania mexicana MHOM/GT/2001/U1103]
MSLAPNTGSVELTAYSAHASRLLARGERIDKRAFDEYRLPTIVREERFGGPAVASAAGGSPQGPVSGSMASTSAVPDGKNLAAIMYTDAYGTCIQCTVQGLLGPPRPEQPAAGRLNVHVEAPFVEHLSGGAASTNYRSFQYMIASGNADLPLRQLEGHIGTVLDGCFDLSQLSIYEGEACWVLKVSVLLLSFDGGLRAGSLHAVLAALHKLHLPRTRLPNGDVIEGRQVQLSCMPVACTFGFLAGAQVRLVADTTAIEEHVADGLITVAVNETERIVSVHHTGRCPLLAQALAAASQQWTAASGAMRKALYG